MALCILGRDMAGSPLCRGVFFSIAYLFHQVEGAFLISAGMDLHQQLPLSPAKPSHRPDIPYPFFKALTVLQDGHVPRPADGHGLCHDFRRVRIRPPELPHTAEVPGGEAPGVRIGFAEILCGGDSRALFRPGADEPADLAV